MRQAAWKWIETDRIRAKGTTSMRARRTGKGRDRGSGMQWVCMQADWPEWEEAEDNDEGVREAWLSTREPPMLKTVEKHAGWHTFFPLQKRD
eukprot:7815303-Prorocentrum_lima.AAC.1